MARAAELPEDRVRRPLRELNAFLSPLGDGAAAEVLGDLDEACDLFLFHGLILSERVEVADGMVLLPYEDVLRFVDEDIVRDFAPSGAGFHGFRSVGAVVRPFRWRPEFRRRGSVNEPAGTPAAAVLPGGGNIPGFAGGESCNAYCAARDIVGSHRRIGRAAAGPRGTESGVLSKLAGRGRRRI